MKITVQHTNQYKHKYNYIYNLTLLLLHPTIVSTMVVVIHMLKPSASLVPDAVTDVWHRPKSLYYCHFPIWYCSYIALLSLLSNVVDPAAGYPHADTAFDVWCFHCCLAPRHSLTYCHFPIWYYFCISWHVQCYVCSCF